MIEFLDLIWPDHGYGEIRAFRDGSPDAARQWYDLADEFSRLEVEYLARKLDLSGFEVYYGVLPRIGYGLGTADGTWPDTTVLWADVDAKHHGDDKSDALDALLMYGIPPTVIVDSGHGYHGYWKLRSPVAFSAAAAAMREIARSVGGDAVYDAARILRLPGLHNHKGGGSEQVRLIVFDTTRRYRFDDFDLPAPARASFRPEHTDYRGEKRPIPEWLADLITNGAPKGQRSEAAYKACLWLIRLGYADGDIIDIFAANPSGIGAKMYDSGLGWLKRTIRKAGTVA